MKRILILSAGTPCRSMMAEGLLKKDIGNSIPVEFIGAGTDKSTQVSEAAMCIIQQHELSIDDLQPRTLEEVRDMEFDLVVTLCSYSKEACPKFPRRVPTIHMEFPAIQEDEHTCSDMVYKIRNKLKPAVLREIS